MNPTRVTVKLHWFAIDILSSPRVPSRRADLRLPPNSQSFRPFISLSCNPIILAGIQLCPNISLVQHSIPNHSFKKLTIMKRKDCLTLLISIAVFVITSCQNEQLTPLSFQRNSPFVNDSSVSPMPTIGGKMKMVLMSTLFKIPYSSRLWKKS